MGCNSPWYYLVAQFYDPADTVKDRLRKNFMGVCFCPLFFVAFLFGGSGLASSDSIAQYFLNATNFIASLVLLGCYLWMRRVGTVTDTLTAGLLWFLTVILTATYICSPHFCNKSMLFTILFVCVMLRHPHMLACGIIFFIQQIFNDWNEAWRDDDSMVLTVPGYKSYDKSLRFPINIAGTVTVFACIYVFNRQVQEIERREAAQLATNQMTKDILRAQRKYDTDNVAEILDDCASEAVVDQELVELFREMNENLLSYKPFLPNYLFLDTEEDDGDDEGSIMTLQDEGTNATDVQHDTSTTLSSLQSYQPKHNKLKGSGKYTDSRSRRSGSSHGGHQQQHHVPGGALKARGPLFEGRISFAVVDINPRRLFNVHSVGKLLPNQVGDRLGVVTNAIYTLAKETKASVHSMLGDQVQLTWNVTNSVALPETKGAQFLCRLSGTIKKKADALRVSDHIAALTKTDDSDVTSLENLKISGMLCSGMAAVHAISAAGQQQSLIIDATWLPILEGGLELATKHKTILMDETTMQTSGFEIDSVPVEKITAGPAMRATDDFNAAVLSNNSSFIKPDPFSIMSEGKYSFVYHSPYCERRAGGIEGFMDTQSQASSTSTVPLKFGNGTPQNPLGGNRSPSSAASNSLKIVSSTIHQILGEKVRDDDEWMYQLQQDQSNPASPSNNNNNNQSRRSENGFDTLLGKAITAAGESGTGSTSPSHRFGVDHNNSSLRPTDYFLMSIKAAHAGNFSDAVKASKQGSELAEMAMSASCSRRSASAALKPVVAPGESFLLQLRMFCERNHGENGNEPTYSKRSSMI